MLLTRDPNKKFQTVHFNDPWMDFLSGRSRREEATRDITKLHSEIYDYRHALFPIRSVPIKDRPGYVTHERNFFRIDTRGKTTSKLLTKYFCSDDRQKDTISYGSADELGSFFEFVLHGLLVDGADYNAIEWGNVKLGYRTFILPTHLHFVNFPTVKERKHGKYRAVQKFSWLARFLNDYYDYEDSYFKKDELLIFRHPTMFPLSPLEKAVGKLKELRVGMTFALWQGKAFSEPSNHTFKVERTRYQLSSDYWRKQLLERVKVRKLFKQSISGLGIGLTTYYEVHAYAEYKKHLNYLRQYLVKEFNQQLLSLVKSKNNIKSELTLEFRGFASNEEIDAAFDLFKQGQLDVDGFLERTKDDYNKDLY